MKDFIDSIKKACEAYTEKHPRITFALQVFWYYLMLMILFLYFMLANLSSAPKFVYTAF